MPVEIRLVPRFILRTVSSDDNTLLLPAIELAPGGGSNFPHISRIVCSVRGTPPALAALIQSAYPEFSSPTAIKIYSPQRLRQSECRLNQPLGGDVKCTLQAVVEYFDSDAEGNPLLSVRKNIAATCLLLTPEASPQPEAPAVEPNPPISASDPQSQMNQPQVSQISFPGWFAVDFGTSNSTVTLFDPKVVSPPDSLPKEQELRLRQRLAQWVREPAAAALPSASASEWENFLAEVSKNLEIEDSSRLGDIFSQGTSSRLLEAIRQIELCLGSRSEMFRRAARIRLNKIFHEAFRIPPLEWQSLISVELDLLRRAIEIPSELQILSLENPLRVLMGERVKQNRFNAIAEGASSSVNEIIGKFHHSPKRYFGQERFLKVTLNGQEDTIHINQLIQAAWAHLIELTEECRKQNPGRFAEGRFSTAVVTYPTIAPPMVRRSVEQLVKNLGIPDVQTAYDEAVSVAIFFLWREFGGDLNIGIESFKTRCHRQADKWSQNVLVLDIGGGTTDIALMSLTLEEIDPFEKNEDRGLGGRYYVLTPKLLGSSGHLQLGGELITLRIFQLLKAAIADCLLTAVTEGRLESEKLEDVTRNLNDRFLVMGKFQKGKLLECVDKENLYPESDPACNDALDDAEKVLPTRGKQYPSRLQTFYTLWAHAEDAKLKLGQNSHPETTFVLSEPEISELLAQSDIKVSPNDPNSLRVELNREQFERAAAPAVKEAIGIAKGLMENRLGKSDEGNPDSSTEKVDWLILSGKTCNLSLVKDEIYQEFSKSKYFVWNEERITFVPEFTKLATSAGACYAEKLRRLIFDPKESKSMLRKGANQLYIDVKNLFYYLPCSFILETIGAGETIFHAGQELYQLAPGDAVAKVRSPWRGASLSSIIKRQDYKDMTPQLWGSFNGKALAERLGMNEFEFRDQIKIQFEIDHKLGFSLLLCRGNPHYFMAAGAPSLDMKKALGPAAVIVDDKLAGDIAIHVQESATAHQTDAEHLVFEAGLDYSESLKDFRYEDKQQGKGLISAPLPEFPRSGKQAFYFRKGKTDPWIEIGQLSRPDGKTEYICKYYVTLDDRGILRLHLGEVPYWTSDRAEVLKEQEGCVFRAELELQPNDIDQKRDPFCGKH
ncbi:virulence factor SrfB [Kamptonema formosum]|uniref:virulence factor SrfB n=1 Tax=Kamptonema formosum TaxID=331992 RepID=UPI000374C573|nr:virulence factor SrfB [Oscillatoria sp. PCC 10802]